MTDFSLEMPAGQKPKATITFTPDILEVEDMAVNPQNLEAFGVLSFEIHKPEKGSLGGKYLEISGDLAGRIEVETEKDLLVRRAIVIDGRIGLCEQAVYVDKKVLDSYWVKIVELSAIPETVNSVDSTNLIRKWLNM